MKRGAKILAAAVSLVVLGGAWFLAETMARTQVEEEETAAAAEPEVIGLSAGEAGAIRGLTWSRNGETVSLTRENETSAWINGEDRACPINQSVVEPLVEAAANVTARAAIGKVTDYEQYGLAEPVMTITVTTAERTVTYDIGGQTLNGEYYVRVAGEDTVYTEVGALLPAFAVTLEDLLAMEAAPGDIGAVKSLSVTTDVTAYEMGYTEAASGQWNSGAYNWFVTLGEERFPLAAEQAEALYANVTDIAFGALVEWHGEDLKDYGLDTPQGTAVVTYQAKDGTEKTFALVFGDYTGGNVYVRMAGSDRIYTTAGPALDRLMYPDWEAMMPLAVFPADLTSVTGAEILLGGHTYHVEIITEASETIGENGEPVIEKMTCYVSNGWTLDSDAAEKWLEDLTALEAESAAAETQGREELLHVTLLRDDEARPEVTLAIWSYDSGRCLCAVNGEDWYFIARADAEALVLEAERLLIIE